MRQSNRGSSAKHDVLAGRLATLRQTDPAAALELAIDTVARERAHRVVEPALAILADAAPSLRQDERARDRAREALRARFTDLTENGVRFDQGCELRVAIVKILREIATPADQDLAEQGLRTIQLQPYARVDVAQALRGQCLLLLDRFDRDRSAFFAVDLLWDPNTSEFNGEPAITAIQLLAERGEILPIWTIARRPNPQPDLLAQTFASLRQAPADFQTAALLDHLSRALESGPSGEGIALVAAEAILLNGLSAAYPSVLDLLRDTSNRNLFLYLAATAARSDDPKLRAAVAGLRTALTSPDKVAILEDLFPRRP